MAAFYNEIDPYAAQWLRNLIAAGHIAPGVVDERSIEDIQPDELHAFSQCHFFAGIGVWSRALRLVGWHDDMPVWTGSCPCQPFSSAGKGTGFADERHLWPHWFHLISECRPAVVFGEQVASSDIGPWIDLVQDDMEALDYAFGAVPFPAAGVGAPHIRDRMYWVADCAEQRQHGRRAGQAHRQATPQSEGLRATHRLADNDANRRTTAPGAELHNAEHHAQPCGGAGVMGDPEHLHGSEGAATDHERAQAVRSTDQPGRSGGASDSLADAAEQRWPGHAGPDDGVPTGPLCFEPSRSATGGFWAGANWIACRDGKWRPVEPGTFPLAHGATARVGRLRAYGNAIVAPQAAEFIRAYQFAQLA